MFQSCLSTQCPKVVIKCSDTWTIYDKWSHIHNQETNFPVEFLLPVGKLSQINNDLRKVSKYFANILMSQQYWFTPNKRRYIKGKGDIASCLQFLIDISEILKRRESPWALGFDQLLNKYPTEDRLSCYHFYIKL